jgi:hypothetical protein
MKVYQVIVDEKPETCIECDLIQYDDYDNWWCPFDPLHSSHMWFKRSKILDDCPLIDKLTWEIENEDGGEEFLDA